MIKLDETRTYGETRPGCHGPNPAPDELPAIFNQDGLYFDAHGDLVESMLTPKDRERITAMEADRKARAAADEAYRDALIAQGIDPDASKIVPLGDAHVAGKPSAPAGDVDLAAWAKGEARFPWAKVQKAFRDQHSKSVSSKDDAVEFLIAKGVIAAEDVKV